MLEAVDFPINLPVGDLTVIIPGRSIKAPKREHEDSGEMPNSRGSMGVVLFLNLALAKRVYELRVVSFPPFRRPFFRLEVQGYLCYCHVTRQGRVLDAQHAE